MPNVFPLTLLGASLSLRGMVTVSSRLEILFDSVPAVMDVFTASLYISTFKRC
jgi:hypothetical protein